MANSAQFVYSPALTDYGLQLGVGSFDASARLAPIHRANYQGVYYKRDRANIGKVDAERAPGEAYKRKINARGETAAYQTLDNGIIIPVPIERVEGYGAQDLFREKQAATIEALLEVQYAHAAAVSSATWGANLAAFQAIYGTAGASTPSTKFDASGANAEEEIKNAIELSRQRSGYRPNFIAMNRTTFDTICSNPNSDIRDKFKYTSAAGITPEMFASLFSVSEVIILDELSNSANAGQTQSYGDLYSGDNILIGYKDSTPSMTKATMATSFIWNSSKSPFMGILERFNEDTQSYEIKANAYFDVQVVLPECGYALVDVLA